MKEKEIINEGIELNACLNTVAHCIRVQEVVE